MVAVPRAARRRGGQRRGALRPPRGRATREPGWAPRPPDEERDRELSALLGRIGKMLLPPQPRRGRCGAPTGQQIVVNQADVVTIIGEPGEVVLHVFGRSAVRVETDGDPADAPPSEPERGAEQPLPVRA